MYTMEELMPVVGGLAEKFTAHGSSSVTYERAEQLMEAVLYCIHETENAGETNAVGTGSTTGVREMTHMSAQQAYETGAQLVRHKTERALEMYNQMLPEFQCYQNRCLYDTVVKGIPEFFKWYDCRLDPQNTILTLDYPLLRDLSGLTGIDRIYAFLECICIEQRFLGGFLQEYVHMAQAEADGMYGELTENVCETVLLSLLEHVLVKKPLSEWKLEQTDRLRIRAICAQTDTAGLRRLLEDAATAVAAEYFNGDAALSAYLHCAVGNIAVRLKNATKYGET